MIGISTTELIGILILHSILTFSIFVFFRDVVEYKHTCRDKGEWQLKKDITLFKDMTYLDLLWFVFAALIPIVGIVLYIIIAIGLIFGFFDFLSRSIKAFYKTSSLKTFLNRKIR